MTRHEVEAVSGSGGRMGNGDSACTDAGGSSAGSGSESGAGPARQPQGAATVGAGVEVGEAGAGERAPGGGEGVAYACSRMNLLRYLQDLGSSFSKGPNHYDVAREKPSVIRQWEDFIDTLRQYRANGKVIYYTDETWANKNMSVYRSWNDGDFRSRLDQPSGKGGRIIIAHVGSPETGLLQGSGLSIVCQKSTGDYDKEMSRPTWLNWLEDNVFPTISGGVLVVDRAPYHLTQTPDTRPATTEKKKAELSDWIVHHQEERASWVSQDWSPLKSKAEMKWEADKHRPAPRYEVQDLARRFNVNILISPVAHPELNPIEMVWGTVKMALKRANINFTMADLKVLVDT